jgi:hypothetical protein
VVGFPVFIAGSAPALVANPALDQLGYDDIDIFVSEPMNLIAAIERLRHEGYLPDGERFERTYHRWLRKGIGRWQTNSMKLSGHGHTVNVVYKLTDGHPITSLAQVLESFDFGLLGYGYDCELGQFQDLRPYLFPGVDPTGPLPMMPKRREDWRNGFISEYQGVREFGRYAKYVQKGFDLSLVRDDLHTGYVSSSEFYLNHDDPEKQTLGKIFQTVAIHIENDEIDKLVEASKEISYKDSLDQIMLALF